MSVPGTPYQFWWKSDLFMDWPDEGHPADFSSASWRWERRMPIAKETLPGCLYGQHENWRAARPEAGNGRRKQCACLQGSWARIVPDSCFPPPSLACISQVLSSPRPFLRTAWKASLLTMESNDTDEQGWSPGSLYVWAGQLSGLPGAN